MNNGSPKIQMSSIWPFNHKYSKNDPSMSFFEDQTDVFITGGP